MKTDPENYDHTEHYRGDFEKITNLSKYFDKEKPTIIFENTTPKPLRGLGRYIPTFESVSNRIKETVILKTQPDPLKGLGRNLTYYASLVSLYKKNNAKQISQNKNNYNYWRGIGKPKSGVKDANL
jgi:hypothetical protein